MTQKIRNLLLTLGLWLTKKENSCLFLGHRWVHNPRYTIMYFRFDCKRCGAIGWQDKLIAPPRWAKGPML